MILSVDIQKTYTNTIYCFQSTNAQEKKITKTAILCVYVCM